MSELRTLVVPPAVALAILTVGDAYALQLRDNVPTIASPGRWALFGGSLAAGESPAIGIRRELLEELSLDVSDCRQFWTVLYYDAFWDATIRHTIFAADVTATWSSHVLHEGQTAEVFPIDALPKPMDPIVCALLERYHGQVRR